VEVRTEGVLGSTGVVPHRLRWSRQLRRVTHSAVVVAGALCVALIVAVAVFMFFSYFGLVGTFAGLALAHTALATPFVVITVTSTLTSFDWTLQRAAQGLGATPFFAFRRVILPLILPGVITGALFAFVTSFDEVVVALFLSSAEQRTLPKQMFSGIREMISPTITAAATVQVAFSVCFLIGVELLRRRSERLRGMVPT